MSNSLDPDQDDVLSDLIWVQIVCKGYQQMTKVAASKERVKHSGPFFGPSLPPLPFYVYMLAVRALARLGKSTGLSAL